MNTLPIINVSNAATGSAAAGKATNTPPTDHSFDQVLSREVNDRNSTTNNTVANTGNAVGNSNHSVSSSSAGNPAPANATSGKTKPDDEKTKQATDTTATGTAAAGASASDAAAAGAATASAAAAAGSAHILALVANVQQTNTSSSASAVGSATGIDAALKNFSAAAANAGQPVASDAALAAATAEIAASKAAPDPNAIPLTDSTAKFTMMETRGNASSIVAAERSQSNIAPNANAGLAMQPALDLSATTGKDEQAGLSALDINIAVASLKAAQTAPAIDATAVPMQVMFNATAMPNNPGDKLTPQVGSAGWDQALGQKVVWMVAGGQQSASLTLNPPDLGPLQVVLNVNNSHATATFTAAQPEVRQALEAAMPKLREMLGDAGIQLGQTAVNSGTAQQQNDTADQNSRSANSVGTTVDSIESPGAITRSTAISAGLGLVDTFA